MRATIRQVVDRARLLLLGVALLCCGVPAAQALLCPTLGPPLAGSFGYNYNLGSSALPGFLVQGLSLPNGAWITNNYDGLARLTATALMSSQPSKLDSRQYGYNAGSLCAWLTNTLGDYRSYAYDSVGRLKVAEGYESGGSTRFQEQLSYGYDKAGNLNWRTNNALVEQFAVNNLNELTTETNGGSMTVAGTTTSPATNVTVSGTGISPGSATLYADSTWARANVSLPNGTGTYTATAQDSYVRYSTNSVTVNLPQSASYTYDANGNLVNDGNRGFAYDAENQLVSVWVTNVWRTDFVYDGLRRRRQRIEYSWSGTGWTTTNAVVGFVYDGNLILQERDVNNLPNITYTRGNDPSGTRQGAGGIGGLLARTDNTLGSGQVSAAHAFYHSDGAGNISTLVNANQAVVARYLYDPFGAVLSQSGPLAAGNAMQFSSMPHHPNSGLSLYAFRGYDPTLQRWINRDPIGEFGGVNLFGFVGNNPISQIDPLGLAYGDWWDPRTYFGGPPGVTTLPNGDMFMLPSSPPPPSVPTVGSLVDWTPDWTGNQRMGGFFSDFLKESGKQSVENALLVATMASGLGEEGEGLLQSGGKLRKCVQKAKDLLDHLRKKGTAPPGYKGGRTFLNDGRGGGEVLPQFDENGNPITYHEYDVNPYQPGQNRGPERMVIGSNGKAYYTTDHYTTFNEIP